MRNILAKLLAKTSIEKKIHNLILKHLDLTESALRTVLTYMREDLEKMRTSCHMLCETVKKMEVRGDEIVKEIWRNIVQSGTSAPHIIPLMSILLGKLDDMLDSTNVLVLELERYLSLEPLKDNWSLVRSEITQGLDKCVRAVELLRECVTRQDMSEISHVVKMVNDIEHDVDVLKNEALLKLAKCRDITCQEYVSLRNIVQIVDNIADLAQDAANLLFTIGVVLLS